MVRYFRIGGMGIMIIDEAGLVRRIKHAYTHGGYKVFGTDDVLNIWTPDWYVKATWDAMPKKALGTIVEHTGFLPKKEGGLRIQAKLDPQTMMMDVVTEEIVHWDPSAPASDMAQMVSMIVSDHQIFQGGDLKAYGVEVGKLGIVKDLALQGMSTEVLENQSMVRWRSEEEQVAMTMVRPTADDTAGYDKRAVDIWKAIESIDMK